MSCNKHVFQGIPNNVSTACQIANLHICGLANEHDRQYFLQDVESNPGKFNDACQHDIYESGYTVDQLSA